MIWCSIQCHILEQIVYCLIHPLQPDPCDWVCAWTSVHWHCSILWSQSDRNAIRNREFVLNTTFSLHKSICFFAWPLQSYLDLCISFLCSLYPSLRFAIPGINFLNTSFQLCDGLHSAMAKIKKFCTPHWHHCIHILHWLHQLAVSKHIVKHFHSITLGCSHWQMHCHGWRFPSEDEAPLTLWFSH